MVRLGYKLGDREPAARQARGTSAATREIFFLGGGFTQIFKIDKNNPKRIIPNILLQIDLLSDISV